MQTILKKTKRIFFDILKYGNQVFGAAAYEKEGILSKYSHSNSYAAFKDFINNLPNKDGDYYEALGEFATKLYQKQCINDEKYFLDKTPRYYHFIPGIGNAFPNAKFIFLFRRPVYVMSSVIKTWGSGQEIDIWFDFR